MKKQILILMIGIISLFLIGNIMAQQCNKIVSQNDAVEKIQVTKQVQVYDNKIIQKSSFDSASYQKAIADFPNKVSDYKVQLSKAIELQEQNEKLKVALPTKPKLNMNNFITTKEVTIQIPRVINVTKYYLDWTSFPDIIKSKTISIPVYQNVTTTINQIKAGYYFDEDKGEFYTMNDCGVKKT